MLLERFQGDVQEAINFVMRSKCLLLWNLKFTGSPFPGWGGLGFPIWDDIHCVSGTTICTHYRISMRAFNLLSLLLSEGAMAVYEIRILRFYQIFKKNMTFSDF